MMTLLFLYLINYYWVKTVDKNAEPLSMSDRAVN